MRLIPLIVWCLLLLPGLMTPAFSQEGTSASVPAEAQRISEGRHFLPNISLHEPIYFLFGVSEEYDTNAKFQLSFKYRLAPRYFQQLYFSYTQLSVWDLGKESSPFHDTSYRPGFFYYVGGGQTRLDGGFLFRMPVGVEHESNGKAEPESRSINIAFAQPQCIFGTRRQQYQLTLSSRFWGYIDKSENKDIDDYRGYADLRLSAEKVAGWLAGLQVAVLARRGTRKNYGSVQVDVSFPDSLLGFGYWYLQYFGGWGETIVDYTVRVKPQVRVGMMAVRW